MSRVAIALTCAIVLTGLVQTGYAQSVDPNEAEIKNIDLKRIEINVQQLLEAGRYDDAARLAVKALETARAKFGAQSEQAAEWLNNLAIVSVSKREFASAEKRFLEALAIEEKLFGPDRAKVATTRYNLAQTYERMAQFEKAARLHERVLAVRRKELGSRHPQTAASLTSLASLYRRLAKYVAAEAAYREALEIHAARQPKNLEEIAHNLNGLAVVYLTQKRLDEAEPLLQRALAIRQDINGASHPEVAVLLGNLASLYEDKGEVAKARPLYRRALEIEERVFGPESPQVAFVLNNLAESLRLEGRLAEARKLHERALGIRLKVLGPTDPRVAVTLNNLASIAASEERFKDASRYYLRSLSIHEQHFGRDHPSVALALNNLGDVYRLQRRFDEAERLLLRALAIRRARFGSSSPHTIGTLNNLASVAVSRQRYRQAENYYREALAIAREAFGDDHSLVSITWNNIGEAAFLEGRWPDAQRAYRAGVSGMIRQRRRQTLEQREERSEAALQRARWQHPFHFLLRATYNNADGTPDADAISSSFLIAQHATSNVTSKALAKMAARLSVQNTALAALVRQRQDFARSWQAGYEETIRAASRQAAARDAKREAANRKELEELDAQIKSIDAQLRKQFPPYASLVDPEPLHIGDVQALLADDEVLIFFVDTAEWPPTPGETFVWAIAKSEARWLRRQVPRSELKLKIDALRCGLDNAAWSGDGAFACSKALGLQLAGAPQEGKPLPFDVHLAHRLYLDLFGPVDRLIRAKKLIVVQSGALATLPLQVLVIEKADGAEGYDAVKWLGQRNALSVLPSVSSLKLLRSLPRQTAAPDPFVGFGNPLLLGVNGRDRRAWARQSCQTKPDSAIRLAQHSGLQSVTAVLARSGLANVEQLKYQVPLPETADELCQVARASRVSDTDSTVYLGARASERQIKAMSHSGKLARARILHFATHGLLAAETKDLAGAAEPALMLTPPTQATTLDDGLLTASEVATLRLNADWVILSACNTAAGESEAGDAFSGLSRGFFYAGARAVLVSHWYVDSQSTVDLVTSAFGAIAEKPSIGKSGAMRVAMSKLISQGGRSAHPANWAPFAIVGEGN